MRIQPGPGLLRSPQQPLQDCDTSVLEELKEAAGKRGQLSQRTQGACARAQEGGLLWSAQGRGAL